MDIKMKNRISIWGFFMTIVIAVYHCGGGSYTPVNTMDARANEVCNTIFNSLAALAMCHFFAISGFLFFYNFEICDYISKLKKRFFTLLVPYLIWQVIYGPILLYRNNNIKKLIRTTFLLECWPPNGPLWYMYILFILSFLSPIFYWLLKKKKSGIILCFCMCVLMYFLECIADSNIQYILQYGYVRNIVSYFPAYILGAYFGIHGNKHVYENNLRDCLVMLCCAMGIECILEGFLYCFVYRIFPILVLYLWPMKKEVSKLNVLNLSFLIYALHYVVDGYLTPKVRNWLLIISPAAFFGNLMGRVISLILIIIFVYIVWRILSILNPKLLSCLTGGRVKPYFYQSNR